jgi:hypothetical protein
VLACPRPQLDPAELGAAPLLRAGFTATAPTSGEELSIDIRDWALRTTAAVGTASRLLEGGRVVGAVDEPSAVHISACDSCRLPRLTGGLEWVVAISAPSGSAVDVVAIDDLDDGTYRVSFVAAEAGTHRLVGTLAGSGREHDSFDSTFDMLARASA